MKKIHILFAMLLIAGFTFGQVMPVQNHYAKHSPTIVKQLNLKTLKPHSRGYTRWYNYGETMDSTLGGGVSILTGNILFPDSTILVHISGGVYAGPWIHDIGDVLDAHDYDFNNPSLYSTVLNVANNTTFKIDSIAMYGIYRRHLSSAIVDTIEFEVSVNNSLPVAYFAGSGINTNLAVDTVFVQKIAYTYSTNSLATSGKKIYKFPLTEQFLQDTLPNGLCYIQMSTADLPTVNAGKYVVATSKFIPGYTWTANVDSIAKKDEFHFLSWEEYPGSWPTYTKRDYNISYIIPWDVRYNVGGGWNGMFVPSFAYLWVNINLMCYA